MKTMVTAEEIPWAIGFLLLESEPFEDMFDILWNYNHGFYF